jgi:heme A synthase
LSRCIFDRPYAFTLLITTAIAAFRLEGGVRLPEKAGFGGLLRRVDVLPMIAMAGTFALIIVGAFVSQMGAGLAYPDWPLFDGKLVSAGGRLADLHYAHRLLAAVDGLLVAGLVWQVLERDRRRPVVVGMVVLGVLFVAQVLIGAANVWLELATSVRILHLALASAAWGVLVFAVAYRLLNPDERTEAGFNMLTAKSRTTTTRVARDLSETIWSYVRLTKPRIIMLLVVTQSRR